MISQLRVRLSGDKELSRYTILIFDKKKTFDFITEEIL